ncbi:NTP transferase domain-containing protein [Brachyspira pilosicoli]|uniref:NTP transferase domain-containing protein n=1 Tax=Brachyspira pilosicoli TaxID=52584 RepID=UPI0030056BCE
MTKREEANNIKNVEESLEQLSSKFSKNDSLVIILAAGHGKRIRSSTSKMLHTIWGVPSIERVRLAVKNGINKSNVTIVVGIKALEVANAVGKQANTNFAYQEKQLGTGHAVKVGLEKNDLKNIKYCYVIYADMGLIDSNTMKEFHDEFMKAKTDMILMTAMYDGPKGGNYYGRVLRTRGLTKDHKKSQYREGSKGQVMGVIEYKDILALKDDEDLVKAYKDEKFEYGKDELLDNMHEYVAGIYGFKIDPLLNLIKELKANNAQNELYLTDLIEMFVNNNLSISTYMPKDNRVVLGFNDKTVLKEMESIARNNVYNKLKNIITIYDGEDFFIDDSVVEQILEIDKDEKPLDIYIGKGAYVGKGVKINYGVYIDHGARLEGNIELGEHTYIGDNALVSCLDNQKMVLSNNVQIYAGNQIRGNVYIGENTTLERGVNVTGSDKHPLSIGKNVLIKGVSYIYGSIVDDNAYIEHCIFYYSHIKAVLDENGKVIKCRFIRPKEEGIESVIKLKDEKIKKTKKK